MKLLSSKPLTLAQVREILSEREKDGEFEYEQIQAKEYCEKFSKFKNSKDAEELIKKILEANKKITLELATSIVNISPNFPETLQTIAQKEKVELSNEEAEEIIKIIKERKH